MSGASNFSPRHANPTAFAWFAEAMRRLHTTDGLITAAVALARHALNDADPKETLAHLRAISDRIRHSVRNPTPTSLLANLHDVLFDQMELRGNTQDYYNPRNSYLPSILETRQGIPISLTLIYKGVADPLGLEVRGLNCPGHFLAEVVLPDETAIIDPFQGGKLLTRQEAIEHMEAVIGRPLPPNHDPFPLATHALWIRRMVLNLQNIFSMHQNEQDLAAMQEFSQLIPMDED